MIREMTSNQAHVRWNKIEAIFHRAIRRPIRERKQCVELATGGDLSLRDEILALIAAHESDPSIFDGPAFQELQTPHDEDAECNILQIAQYRIVGVLGTGGMGIVFKVEQVSPPRTVALKLLRFQGPFSQKRLNYFQREIRILAQLTHPGIAKVYDAGETPEKQHFFTMELVEGLPLDQYFRDHTRHSREILRLFCKICEAIQHAHDSGVVHRDLKPSNIMVRQETIQCNVNPRPSVPEISVLDFGLARFLHDDSHVTRSTIAGGVIGTPAYMSPEQIDSKAGSKIDARSDQYSLAVILYELLAGHHPYVTAGMTSVEIARRICGRSAPRLGSVRADCRGDVEAVISKALELDPKDRYESVALFAEDIRRITERKPISFRRSWPIYVTRRWITRNRTIAASMGLVAVLAGTTAALWIGQESASTELASWILPFDQRTQRLRLFNESEPDRALEANSQDLDSLPTEYAVLKVLGTRAIHSGRFDDAQKHLQNALVVLGFDVLDRQDERHSCMRNLAYVYTLTNQVARASDLQLEIADMQEARFGNTSVQAATANRDAARSLIPLGRFSEAEELLKRARSSLTETLGHDHVEVLLCDIDEGILHGAKGEAEQAIERLTRALKKLSGENTLSRIPVLHALSGTYALQGDYVQAQTVLDQARELLEILPRNDHTKTRNAFLQAMLDTKLGQHDRSIDLLMEARSKLENTSTEQSTRQTDILLRLGGAYWAKGDYGRAEPLMREVLETEISRDPGGESVRVATARNNLGVLLRDYGKYAEAKQLLLLAINARVRLLGAEHPSVGSSLINLSVTQFHVGDLDDAWDSLKRASDIRHQSLPPEHPDHAESAAIGGMILAAKGEFEQSEKYLVDALKRRLDCFGEAHETVASVRLELCRCLLRQKRIAEAGVQLTIASDILAKSELLPTHRVFSVLASMIRKYESAHPAAIRNVNRSD